MKKITILLSVLLSVFLLTGCGEKKEIDTEQKNAVDDLEKNNGSSVPDYDKTVAYGTPVKFTFPSTIQEIDLPKTVGNEITTKVGNITWHYYLDKNGNAIEIYTMDELSGNVVLPSTINGHKIISIGKSGNLGTHSSLFYGKDKGASVTSVVVPTGVLYISDCAFYNLDKLEKIVLPDTIVYIGYMAFYDLDNLMYMNSDIKGHVVLPKNLKDYGTELFAYCKKIQTFEFPGQITFIRSGTFYQTKSLDKIVIPKQFKYIGNRAFGSTSMTSLVIEEGVQIIEESAFHFNEALKEVTVANSVLAIGSNAFRNATNLEKFNYNGKLQYLGENAFKGCKREDYLKKTQLPQ